MFDHFVGLALKGLKDYQYYLLVGKRCYHLKNSEAATRGVLRKKVFLEILQTSQENTCARVSFFFHEVAGLMLLSLVDQIFVHPSVSRNKMLDRLFMYHEIMFHEIMFVKLDILGLIFYQWSNY